MTNYDYLLTFNARAELAKRHFKDFIEYTKPDYQFNWHHVFICNKLEEFARGEIKKLMLFVPPQHGKSEIATRRFPAYKLGTDPTTKIVVCSYSATLAASFNRDIQRVIDDEKYHDVFPDTLLNESNVSTSAKGSYLRNSEIFEIVGHRGFVKTVGVGGSLTGTPVDVGIIDDPFKDREEAMSIRIRDKVYSWYTDVFCTRLHNHSQQLIIMTRWDQDDLAGRILKEQNDWEVISFPAIKEKETIHDPRKIGEALWPEKHSLERLLEIKKNNSFTFNSLYQQDPKPSTESLIFPTWSEFDKMPGVSSVFGLDFGFSNAPTAIVEVQKRNNRLYAKEIFYKTGILNSKLIEILKNCRGTIYADCEDSKTIAELQGAGLPVISVTDKKIIPGINWIKDHQLFIHKDSHNLKNELNSYQWLTMGGSPVNIPVPGADHLLDAIRYTKQAFLFSVSLPKSHR